MNAFRKTLVAIAAAATLGATGLASTQASAEDGMVTAAMVGMATTATPRTATIATPRTATTAIPRMATALMAVTVATAVTVTAMATATADTATGTATVTATDTGTATGDSRFLGFVVRRFGCCLFFALARRAYSVEAPRRHERLGAFLFGGLVGWRQVATVEIAAVTPQRRPQQFCVSIDELVEGIAGPAKKLTSVSGDENRRRNSRRKRISAIRRRRCNLRSARTRRRPRILTC